MPLNILFTRPIFPKIMKQKLGGHARILVAKNRKDLEKKIATADALCGVLSDPVDSALLRKGKKLRVIGNYAVGLNNIDLNYCKEHHIAVVHTPKVLTRAIAELALTLLLACARRVYEGEKLCREGRFKGWAPEMLLGAELQGRRAVIVGDGRIGKETARLFRAVGLRVEFIRHKTPVSRIRTLLAKAQVLSLHIPYTRENHHWLNQKRMELLPRDCIVLNTARGNVVDEKALIQHLKKRKIFAAGFDVYEHEPQIPKELRKLPNVILLPHLGSATTKTRHQMAECLFDGILAVLAGRKPWNQFSG